MRANTKLVSFIKEARKRGFDDFQIREPLLKKGWPSEEIEKAFKEWKAGREDKLRKMLIPAEIIKQIITSVQVKEEAVKELLNGKPLMKKEIASSEPSGSENSKLAVFNKERFIGIYKVIEDKDILARAEFVLN